MAISIVFFHTLVLIVTVTASAPSDVVLDLVNHIERLDAKMAALEQKHEADIATLKENSGRRESQLLRQIVALTERVAILEDKADDLTESSDRGSGELIEELRTEDKKIVGKIRSQPVPFVSEHAAKPRRAISADYNIAFSSYMDHDVNNLGVGQTLHFNQILLNDGNGYNKHSGVFTAPVAGVYSFTFFIGQRDYHDAGVALFVNDVNTVDAIVETDVTSEDAQGGNSAVLKVAAGDIVFVKMTFGNHLEGSTGGRYTTFSGFLLYPVEGGSVAVGK